MNLLLLSLLFAGPKDARILELQKQVAELQGQLIECQNARLECETAAPVAPDAMQEAEAAELYAKALDQINAFDAEGAKETIDILLRDYPRTRAASRAPRTKLELDVVGLAAPPLAVETWFQGQADYNPTGLTLLVFWEVWCPHCKRELPQLEERTRALRETGQLTVIGLTRITKTSTPEAVLGFLAESAITFPIGKEQDGQMSEAFNVSGIPAAAVVQDGVVIWRGHPARLTDEGLRSRLD